MDKKDEIILQQMDVIRSVMERSRSSCWRLISAF